MADQYRVVVIGGGVVGASVCYHLAKLGWSDIALVEKNELTAGSTWHAAGNGGVWSGTLLISRFMSYTIELYKRLEAETGQAVGIHQPGSLTVTRNPDRLDDYRRQFARGKTVGLDFAVMTPDECKEMVPLMRTDDLVGAIWDAQHGHFDPSSATQAMAKAPGPWASRFAAIPR